MKRYMYLRFDRALRTLKPVKMQAYNKKQAKKQIRFQNRMSCIHRFYFKGKYRKRKFKRWVKKCKNITLDLQNSDVERELYSE